MALTIKVPFSYPKERAYIIDVLFGKFLGLDYRIKTEDRSNILISLDGVKSIILPDILFKCPEEKWLTLDSLPEQPLHIWDAHSLGLNCRLTSYQIPIIYGYHNEKSSPFLKIKDTGSIKLPIDILGSAFFMLTRYEEIANRKRDSYNRFQAQSSIAYQEGFLDRPIVNEYLEILWSCLSHLWQGLKRVPRKYNLFLSHDVDIPLISNKATFSQYIKGCVGDLIKRKSFSLAKKRLIARIDSKHGKYDRDPFNTFEFMMNISERKGVKSTFNFMCVVEDLEIKLRYDLENQWIQNLISTINLRGHKIGFHPNLNTYKNIKKTSAEFTKLHSMCLKLGISQKKWGGRQHRLQWENPVTWQIWNDLGLDYDSTLTFAEKPGFRCGVCYEYPVFNLLKRDRLKLNERPLIVMEGSLFSYMKVNLTTAYNLILALSQKCKMFDGDFSFLCHNSQLLSPKQQSWYKRVMDQII